MKKVYRSIVGLSAVIGFLAGASAFAEISSVLSAAIVGGKSDTYVKIAPGTFQMGSPESEVGRGYYETPHVVTISRGFEMGATTVTQLQWFTVMGHNPSEFFSALNCADYIEINGVGICPNNPVENISWSDTQDFISRLNKKNDGYNYRLPTEAEWEYAARASTQTAYSFGDNPYSPARLQDYAWYSDNSRAHTHSVATKKPNAWGLYDMSGNVWQWVQDFYQPDYQHLSAIDPLATSGSVHVRRGGCWLDRAQSLRSSARWTGFGERDSYVGLRLVRTSR